MYLGVFYLRASRTADVTTDIDYIDAVGHVNLSLVHIVKHLLGAFRPYLIISTMTKESNRDNDVFCKCETFLRFQELLLEVITLYLPTISVRYLVLFCLESCDLWPQRYSFFSTFRTFRV